MKKIILVVLVAFALNVLSACQPIGTSTCVLTVDLHDVHQVEGTIVFKNVIKSKHERVLSIEYITIITPINKEDVEPLFNEYNKIAEVSSNEDYIETKITNEAGIITLSILLSEHEGLEESTYYEIEDAFIEGGFTCTFE